MELGSVQGVERGSAGDWLAELREPESPQPGSRPPAPGRLSTVQAFINSHFDLVVNWGADLLHTPAGLREWCTQRGLMAPGSGQLSDADVERAVAVREGLRALAAAGGQVAAGRRGELARADRLVALNAAAEGLRFQLVFGGAGAQLEPANEEPVARALAVVLSIAYRAMLDGGWVRLKICPGEHCGWAFYDHSRNKSGRWCSMSVCGGRAKARSHYLRARGG